jgi:RecA-family ATPase
VIAEFNVSLAGLDTIAHFFGVNENVRREVARFIRMLDAISITRDCALEFPAQPSARGKAPVTMESGSTHWEAGVRSRLSWVDPDTKDDDDRAHNVADITRRRLTRVKANYARPGEFIDLILRNGGFVPEAVDPETAKTRQRGPAHDAACDQRFLERLAQVREQGRYVHDFANVPGRYAPKVFAVMDGRSGFSEAAFTRSMSRLFDAGRIKIAEHNRQKQLVEAQP